MGSRFIFKKSVKKKFYFLGILPLLFSLVFLTGCGEKKETLPSAGGAFLGGTTGLTLEFLPISVKEGGIYTVFEEETFPLEVVLRNQGEEEIKKGEVSLKLLGVPKESFSGITWEKKNKEDLEKKSEYNPLGGEETISFAEKAKYNKEVTGLVDFTFNVEYQYKYKTYLIIDNVCFKGDPQDTRICEIEETKTFSVSSAPLTVDLVKEELSGKGLIALLITVRKAGLGKLTLPGEEFDNRFDQFSFEIDEPEKWVCKSEGKENQGRIYPGSTTATVRCKLKKALTEEELYVAPVKLTFSYVYKDTLKETVRIKESLE